MTIGPHDKNYSDRVNRRRMMYAAAREMRHESRQFGKDSSVSLGAVVVCGLMVAALICQLGR